MFKIEANPTFDVTLTLVGQGREQTLHLTYRHMKTSKYMELLDQVEAGKKTPADVLLTLVDAWDADGPLDAKGVKSLQENQPGADWAIINTYGEHMTVSRKGN